MKQYISLIWILLATGCTGSTTNGTTLELHGGLYMKGTGTHTYLVIEESKTHTKYKIRNPDHFDLNNQQKKTITLEAKLVKKAVGPGFPAEIEVVKVKN